MNEHELKKAAGLSVSQVVSAILETEAGGQCVDGKSLQRAQQG